MANTKTAIKRAKQAAVRTRRNMAVRSTVRTAIRHVHRALEAGDLDKAREAFRRAVKVIDKAASKGVIHKNSAARKKSRLARKIQLHVTTTQE